MHKGRVLRSPCGSFFLQLIEPEPNAMAIGRRRVAAAHRLGTPDVPAAVAALRARGMPSSSPPDAHARRGALTQTQLGSACSSWFTSAGRARKEASMSSIADFGMDTITLAGPLSAKLRAIREAGFSQVMLSARDLVGHPGGWRGRGVAERHSGLRVTGFQVLRDFEGLSGHLHDYKVDIAKAMLEMCAALDCRVLLVCSSTSTHASDDLDTIARDLRKLAMLAVPLGIKVAFEGLSWGRTINEFTTAWDVVCRADCPNLGLGFDSFHMVATQDLARRAGDARPAQDLPRPAGRLHVDRGALVRGAHGHGAALPRLPGRGGAQHAIADLVIRLDRLGYRGDYSFEVFNDDYQQIPLDTVAHRAEKSAQWLAETILQRSVPLPGKMHLRKPVRA